MTDKHRMAPSDKTETETQRLATTGVAVENQMLNNTHPGDVVLDLFGGSGTTIIAAEKNGRHARVIELDPRYCDVIVRRWQAFAGKQAVLEGSGQTFDELAAVRVPGDVGG